MKSALVFSALVSLSLMTAAVTRAQTTDTATVTGAVLDASGAVISGAGVVLPDAGESPARATHTAPDGTFTFAGVPAGSYVITVHAPGFQDYRSASFTLMPRQAVQLPAIVLSIATTGEKVVVRPTAVIAAEQIRAEEKQRVLGVIPDFYTSYVWNAAPLTAKQKFSLALRAAFDPVALVATSVGAGVEQATNAFPGYGRGGQGYAKRWGALFANGRTSEMLTRAVFPSLFHQDPRYFYQGSGPTWSRIRHAVGSGFVARNDSGHLMPDYSHVLGALSAGALSNLYYPDSSRGVGLIFANAGIGLAGRAGANLIREFVFKRLTKHVPGTGKAATQ